ncbi:MAG TPA: glutaminase A [Bacillaceae bacterium]
MTCTSNEELAEMLKLVMPYTKKGEVIDYIPALRREDPSDVAVAIFHKDGTYYNAGRHLEKFTLQSISKVITLAYVLMERGTDYVFNRVGMEPTGDPFNSIVRLETIKPSKPLNPMINAGALAVTDMIAGSTIEEKWEKLIDFVGQLTDDHETTYNEIVARSEFDTAFLNRALCYYLKQHGIVTGHVEELMDLYTRQCAIEMNCSDLARVGAVFAMDGCDPYTGRQTIPKDIAKICKTFMVTCGMYNASGEFAIRVGIPAKSGVSGGIMGSIPGECGIGIFGPALDAAGNSVAGLKLLEIMSKRYGWSIF